jgi:hypothetical protein
MSDAPGAYITKQRLRRELGGIGESTLRRWMKKPGFPQPKPSGLFKWSEVEAWMDGPRRRNVTSPPLSEEEEIRNAIKAYEAWH